MEGIREYVKEANTFQRLNMSKKADQGGMFWLETYLQSKLKVHGLYHSISEY